MHTRHTNTLIALTTAILGIAPTAAGQDKTASEKRRPRIGLVLSGGGARGAAHVGVLKVLEELRIPIDLISSNSMGAMIGGTYAFGYTPEQLQEVLTNVDWGRAMTDSTRRDDRSFRRKQDDLSSLIDLELGFQDFGFVLPRGIASGHHAINIFKFLTPGCDNLKSFDDLPIPYRAVATDIATGKQVILGSGSLPSAMAASGAIPGVLAPVKVGDKELMDGMVVNNIPIDVALGLKADIIIAVDVGTPILEGDEIATLLNVTEQMLSILMQRNVDEQLALISGDDRHVLIRPDLEGISTSEFGRIPDAIERGEKAARAVMDQLRRYSVSEEEYAKFRARRRPKPDLTYAVVDKIRIVNTSGLSDAVILAKMNTQVGEKLDPDVLQGDLDRIFGTKEFERVTFEFSEIEDGENELRILADQKSWGPSYIRFGLELEDNFNGSSAFNFRVNYTARAINSLGGEWRNEIQLGERAYAFSEFYQPLTESGRFFVAPLIEYRNQPVNLYQAGAKIAEYDVDFGNIGIDGGILISNCVELRLGVRRSQGRAEPLISTTPVTGFSFDDGYVQASLTIDTLDEVNFPSAGTFFRAEWDAALEELGADAPYQRVAFGGLRATTFAKNTFLLTADFGTSVDQDLPIYRQHARGGFHSLSGFQSDELVGQHAAVGKLVYYRQVSGIRNVTLGLPIYVGGSLEIGSVTNLRKNWFDDPILAGSAFLGVDSPVGPIYLAYGYAEGGTDSMYLFLGRSF